MGRRKNFSTDTWSTIVAAVKQAETNGIEYPYEVGNTKTVDMGSLGVHTIRVANTTKCSEVTVESKTACGFVLEFADIITTHSMNGTDLSTSTNAGGWPASAMRTYVNSTIYNALPEELRKGIINTYVVSSYGSDKTTGVVENENAGVLESELYWSNDKLYLLSPEEVYGTSFTESDDKSNGTSRQLDYYEDYQGNGYTGVSTTNYAGAIKYKGNTATYWWLRSAYSNSSGNFFRVSNDGYWPGGYANYSSGLSPAFRLAE